jgi:hypothetical protein
VLLVQAAAAAVVACKMLLAYGLLVALWHQCCGSGEITRCLRHIRMNGCFADSAFVKRTRLEGCWTPGKSNIVLLLA